VRSRPSDWIPSEGKGKEGDEGMGCHWEGEELRP
jgi:hypothetical protein